VALPQHECHIVLSVSPHGSQDQVFYTLQPLPYNIKVKIQIRIIKKKKKSDLRVSRNEKLTHVKQLREVPHLQPTTRDQTHLKNDVHNSPPFLNSIS
jgi:hypothetical protein